MKLRIKGNSLRLRLAPSEVARLLQTGRVEDTVRFAKDEEAKLTYAIECSTDQHGVAMRYRPREVAVLLPIEAATSWANGEPVGIYADLDVGGSRLEVAVEKDFSCLHGDEREIADTFPNPRLGSIS